MTGTTSASLHQLPAWADVTAMTVAALFTAHVARRRRVPLFGVLLARARPALAAGPRRRERHRPFG